MTLQERLKDVDSYIVRAGRLEHPAAANVANILRATRGLLEKAIAYDRCACKLSAEADQLRAKAIESYMQDMHCSYDEAQQWFSRQAPKYDSQAAQLLEDATATKRAALEQYLLMGFDAETSHKMVERPELLCFAYVEALEKAGRKP